jgi:hypothetical protein
VATLTEIETQLDDADISTKEGAARAAVEKAPSDKKQDVAKAAVTALSPDQQAELQKSLWPQSSGDRKAVYITGFSVAGAIAIALTLVAWGAANTGNDSVATAVLVALTGFTGAILGGLFGAYKGQ